VSRDAKVGLVIVFTFVFLLGTILIHRLESTMAGGSQADPNTGAVAVDERGGAVGAEGEPVGADVAEASATTVDAGPGEPLPIRSGGRSRGSLSNAGFPTASNSIVQSSGTRTAQATGEEVAAGSHGADIVFAEPSGDAQGAIVVDPPQQAQPRPIRGQPRRSPTTTAALEPGPSTTTNGRPSPLLEVGGGTEQVRRDVIKFAPTQGDPDTEQDTASAAEEPAARPTGPPSSTDEMTAMDGAPDSEANTETTEPFAASPSPQRPIGSARTNPRELPEPIIESVDEGDSAVAAPRTSPTQGMIASPRANQPRELPDNVAVPRRSSGTAVRQDRTYVVKSGDSYWSISAKSYGSGKHFRALEQYNLDRVDSPAAAGRPLRPGDVVLIPDVEVLRSTPAGSIRAAENPGPRPSPTVADSEPEPAATPESYRVRDGDSLVSISKRMFGTSKRWEEIYWLNQDKLPDPHQLKVGMELRLPPAKAEEKVADRPTFRR